jgi:hypothetical protein
MSTLKRQGDILLEKVHLAVDPLKRVVEDGVIARGEVTGHAHRVEGGVLVHTNRGMAVVSDGETTVTHDEHSSLELEEGIWLVHRQVEYVGPGEEVGVYD